MSDVPARTSPKDGFITFGVIYVLLTACGALTINLWMWPPARLFASLLFAVLVAMYALVAPPGRRTGWRIYLLIGLGLPWFVLFLMFAIYISQTPDDPRDYLQPLTGGFGVSFKLGNIEVLPFPLTLFLWTAGILLAVMAGPVLRQARRANRAK